MSRTLSAEQACRIAFIGAAFALMAVWLAAAA